MFKNTNTRNPDAQNNGPHDELTAKIDPVVTPTGNSFAAQGICAS